MDKGTIRFGPTVLLKDIPYAPIIISNYRNELLEGIKLSVPSYVDIYAIDTSNPIHISKDEDVIGVYKEIPLTISGIESNQITSIYVPLENEEDLNRCRILNAQEVGLKVKTYSEIFSPSQKIFMESLPGAIIAFLLVTVLIIWKSKEVDESQKGLKRAEKQIRETDRSILEIKNLVERQKLLLLSRISDYTKELDFWRDTIRKILFSQKFSKQKVEAIITQVTNNLETYGTLKQANDFDAISTLAGMLEKQNKESKT